jgi:hypothetical protein
MAAMERPHFLRVVQALSMVSGFGPVALVAGASLLGCSSSTVPVGSLACTDASDCATGPTDAAPDAFQGITTGTQPACTLDEAGTCVDASIGSGGVQVAPEGGADVQVVGGPLPPPELPA